MDGRTAARVHLGGDAWTCLKLKDVASARASCSSGSGSPSGSCPAPPPRTADHVHLAHCTGDRICHGLNAMRARGCSRCSAHGEGKRESVFSLSRWREPVTGAVSVSSGGADVVRRAPSGARVQALPPGPPSPPSPGPCCAARRPGSRETPVGRCLSRGLLGALVRSARRPADSGSRGLGARAPGPAHPLAPRHQLPREPRPGSRPLGRYHWARARGGGGGAGPLKSAARRPDPPAPAPLWSRLDCGGGASRWTLAPPTAPSASGAGEVRPSGSVHAGGSLLPFSMFFQLTTVI